MSYLKLEECKHGGLYRISSRNLSFGIYREDVRGFIGIREKFSVRYLDTERHYDVGPPFGTVCPKEYLEDCPLVLEEDNTALFEWLEMKEKQYATS